MNQVRKTEGDNIKMLKKQRNAEDKFAMVMESSIMSEAEISEYCRSHGIYREELEQWKPLYVRIVVA